MTRPTHPANPGRTGRVGLPGLPTCRVKHRRAPDAVAEAAETSESRFLNGTLGMLFNSRRGVPTYRTITSFAWDVARCPVAGSRPAFCTATAAAWPPPPEQRMRPGRLLVCQQPGRANHRRPNRAHRPLLIAVAESDAFLEPNQSPANSRASSWTLSIMQRVPGPMWIAVEDGQAEIERAFYGQIPSRSGHRPGLAAHKPILRKTACRANSASQPS